MRSVFERKEIWSCKSQGGCSFLQSVSLLFPKPNPVCPALLGVSRSFSEGFLWLILPELEIHNIFILSIEIRSGIQLLELWYIKNVNFLKKKSRKEKAILSPFGWGAKLLLVSWGLQRNKQNRRVELFLNSQFLRTGKTNKSLKLPQKYRADKEKCCAQAVPWSPLFNSGRDSFPVLPVDNFSPSW